MADNLTVKVKLPDRKQLVSIDYDGTNDGRIDGGEKGKIAAKLAELIPAEKRTDEYLKKVIITGEPITVAGAQTPTVNLNARFFLTPQAAQKKAPDESSEAKQPQAADDAKTAETAEKPAKPVKTGRKGGALKAKPVEAESAEKTDESKDVDYDAGKDVKPAKVVIPGHSYTYTKKNAEGEAETDDDGKPVKATGYVPAKTIEFDVKSNNVRGIGKEDAQNVVDYIDSHADKFKAVTDASKTNVTLEGETVSLDRLRRIAKDELPGTEKPEDKAEQDEAGDFGELLADTSLVSGMMLNLNHLKAQRRAAQQRFWIFLQAIMGGNIDAILPALRQQALSAVSTLLQGAMAMLKGFQQMETQQSEMIGKFEDLSKGDKPNYARMQALSQQMSLLNMNRNMVMNMFRDIKSMSDGITQSVKSMHDNTLPHRVNLMRFT